MCPWYWLMCFGYIIACSHIAPLHLRLLNRLHFIIKKDHWLVDVLRLSLFILFTLCASHQIKWKDFFFFAIQEDNQAKIISAVWNYFPPTADWCFLIVESNISGAWAYKQIITSQLMCKLKQHSMSLIAKIDEIT